MIPSKNGLREWDHLMLRDIDLDGDLDIVGNVQEHYYWKHSNDTLHVSYFSVVWFGNPLK
jgi:hypothetical protein